MAEGAEAKSPASEEGSEKPRGPRKSLVSSISFVEFPETELEEYLPGQVWLKMYYLRVAGATFSARTTVVKLHSGDLWVHNPGGPLDDAYKSALAALGGSVAFLIAPSDFHHVYLPAWQEAFLKAQTFICPGLETKAKALSHTGILEDQAPEGWRDQFQQLVIKGRAMSEVLFLHSATKTLIVTALVEFLTDDAVKKDGTEASWGTWLWVKMAGQRNRALPAVSYRLLGFPDKQAVKDKLNKVVTEWCPERVVLSHGELVDGSGGAEAVRGLLLSAWDAFLKTPASRNPSLDEPPKEETNKDHKANK